MRRGDVFKLKIAKAVGHEQAGDRFGVVLQADALLTGSTVIVAPTSKSAKPASFRPEIMVDGAKTRVLVEQLGVVDTTRLTGLVGHLTHEEIWDVNYAVQTVLDRHGAHF